MSKLARDWLQGAHPDLVRVVERAIQITTRTSGFGKAGARVSAGRFVADNPAIESGDRITSEKTWVNTLSWPTRAVVCRKDGSYILYNHCGSFSWYLFGPDNRLQYDIAGTLGNGTWGYIVGSYDKDAGRTTNACI